jgi:type IV pilus assembly protein PilO
MRLLPEDPKDQYRVLGIILPVALAFLFYFYVYAPRVAELDLLEDRVADMEMQNRMARERTKNLDRLREDLALAELRFAALERLVPTGAEVPEIYEAIASESEALNLDLRNVIPIEAEADSAAYFLRQNWEMEVEGSYHDLGDFLTRVASFDRIVRPQVREILPVQGADPSSQPVTAYFQLETFVLPAATNLPARAGAGDSGG